MVLRKCPKCGTTTDDIYGFCIKCGYEFPKIEKDGSTCPLCGFSNPDEADFCVKCGTPLIFKSQFDKNHDNINPIIIKKEIGVNNTMEAPSERVNKWIIVFGYIFSILGGILGLIIAIYLATRKNPEDKKHGYIQLTIFAVYLLILVILISTGNLSGDILNNYTQLVSGNLTSFNR